MAGAAETVLSTNSPGGAKDWQGPEREAIVSNGDQRGPNAQRAVDLEAARASAGTRPGVLSQPRTKRLSDGHWPAVCRRFERTDKEDAMPVKLPNAPDYVCQDCGHTFRRPLLARILGPRRHPALPTKPCPKCGSRNVRLLVY